MADVDGAGRQSGTSTWWRVIRACAIAASILVGTVLVLGSVILGDCSAFGGTCPARPEPLLDDDTFWGAFLGTALAVAGTLFLLRPSIQGATRALFYAAPVALVVGLIARSSAAS